MRSKSRALSALGAVTALLGVGLQAETAASAEPNLVGHWTFSNATESTGNWGPLSLRGTGSISGGELAVSGTGNGVGATGWALATGYTGPAIADKTLVARVRLDTLTASGSPLAVHSGNGDVFDAIVYAEQQSARWMAGSNNFIRTQPFPQNVNDTAAGPNSMRQIAISYRSNGNGTQTISGCLNGVSLGGYTATIQTFSAGSVNALFGPRHLSGTQPVGSINAHIDEARLYNRAMTCGEIALIGVDADSDGVADAADNCPQVANPGQANLDGDGLGDACDGDIDGDGVGNAQDAFPRDPAESADSDGDSVGDNADAFPFDGTETRDSDADGVGDNRDRFPNDPAESADTDGDGVGDNADAFPADATESRDSDGDGVGDRGDNCATDANADQFDLDSDQAGDACDPDIDGDGVGNGDDAFPRNSAESRDTDGDGIGDNGDRFPNDPAEQADSDDDGVGDRVDNCRLVTNAGQTDGDADGIGDACDPDADGDQVVDLGDNCPLEGNADQSDLDADGIGDACDPDIDGDGTANGEDFAPRDASEFRDADGDGVGDNADVFPNDGGESRDADQDHVGDNGDNCPAVANEGQADLDDDNTGDACDADIDGDGVGNSTDVFPRNPDESKDTDGDGIGDNADRFPTDPDETGDADGDGTGDNSDNCRTVANADQANLDRDGLGDACDPDIDGDGVANGVDNAPRNPNADQQDLDGDGVGDVIDAKVLPLNGEQCKKDGWKRFYDSSARFKNQGDCVSFVSTGGRNLPAGR